MYKSKQSRMIISKLDTQLLPNEIIKSIVGHIGSEAANTRHNQWMFINKQWHDVYYAINYKSISIGRRSPDAKLENIMHSVFEPGKWVHYICFASLMALIEDIEGVKNVDPQNNPLFQLMFRCPYVDSVSFERWDTLYTTDISTQEWAYFTKVLTSNNIWKLRKLSTPNEDNPDSFGYYYKCAYHVRDTLQVLFLMEKMIDSDDYGQLKEFKSLTKLEIGANILQGLEDCCKFLSTYVPDLKKLQVDFFQNSSQANPGVVGSSNSVVMVNQEERNEHAREYYRNNMKDLTIIRYTPTTEDLKYMMKSFTKLDNLLMSDDYLKDFFWNTYNWPAAFLGQSIIASFLKYINGISSYDILVEVDNPVQLIQDYCESDHYIKERRCSVSISLSLTPYEFLRSAMFNNIKISLERKEKCDKKATKIGVKYILLDDDSEQQHAAAMDFLGKINNTNYVGEITIHLEELRDSLNFSDIINYINSIFSMRRASTNMQLKTLQFYGGFLSSLSAVIRPTTTASISHLKLTYTKISQTSLPNLSMAFPTLASLELYCCKLFSEEMVEDFSSHIKIMLPQTNLKNLYVHGEQEYLESALDDSIKPILLLTVGVAVEGQGSIFQYFISTQDSDGSILNISRRMHDCLMNALEETRRCTVMEVVVKSIDFLNFSAGYHVFSIPF